MSHADTIREALTHATFQTDSLRCQMLCDAALAALDELVAENKRLREAAGKVLARHPRGCGVRFGSRPPEFTCLDRKAEAADPESRYVDEFRAEVMADEHTCDVCLIRAALAVGGAPKEKT